MINYMHAHLGLPAAASFKHCSPAGAALATELTDAEAQVPRGERSKGEGEADDDCECPVNIEMSVVKAWIMCTY